MVRQLGYTPEQFARHLIDKEGGVSKANKVFNRSSDKKSEYTPVKVKEVSSGYLSVSYTHLTLPTTPVV